MGKGYFSAIREEMAIHCLVFSMIDRQKLSLILLTGTVAITRFVFRNHFPLRSGFCEFCAGDATFRSARSPAASTGYFLYICLGRLLHGNPEATWTTERSVYVPLHPGMVPVNSRAH